MKDQKNLELRDMKPLPAILGVVSFWLAGISLGILVWPEKSDFQNKKGFLETIFADAIIVGTTRVVLLLIFILLVFSIAIQAWQGKILVRAGAWEMDDRKEAMNALAQETQKSQQDLEQLEKKNMLLTEQLGRSRASNRQMMHLLENYHKDR